MIFKKELALNVVIIRPIINLLLVLYRALGHHTILAIVSVTMIFRLALVPLTLSERRSRLRSAYNQQELKSNMKRIEEEYKDNPVKLTEEQIKLYQSISLDPLGGCLITLIQFPILIGVYRAIVQILAVTPIQLLELPDQIYPWLPNLSTLIPLNSRFLWFDLALRDPYLILPILVFAMSWLRHKTSRPSSGQTTQKWNKYIDMGVPLLVAVLSANYASGLGIYLLISSLSSVLEHYLFIRPKLDTVEDFSSV